MTKFARILAKAIQDSGLSRAEYAQQWDVPPRTLRHWLEDSTPPSSKHMEKITDRFPLSDHPGLFDLDEGVRSGSTDQSGLWTLTQTKIMLARMNITNLMFIFGWLVYDAGPQERNQFRDTLGPEWESFMNLARALVNEKSREVGFTEKRLNNSRRHE